MRARREEGADELEAQFSSLVDELRRDVRRLRGLIERFGRAVEKRAEAGPRRAQTSARDDATRLAYRRLKQLQLVVTHIESSAAYLLGSGVEPAEERDERIELEHRMLEGLEAERERLHRDIHDGPAQVLANAIFELEYIERQADRAPAEVRQTLRSELAALRGRLRDSLDSVRAMIYDLRPPVLSELGLAGALRTYASEYQSRYGLGVECDFDTADTQLSPQQELAVYRVMQEALQNVHKHGRATTVVITWGRAPDGWHLRCTDDGVGFDLVRAARRQQSFGLVSMRERAELIGGSLQIQSAPGRGTTVTLHLPLGTRPETSS